MHAAEAALTAAVEYAKLSGKLRREKRACGGKVAMPELGRGSKCPSTASGAPHPPATDHDDGPEHPRRDVPSTDHSVDEPPRDAPSDETEAETQEEDHAP